MKQREQKDEQKFVEAERNYTTGKSIETIDNTKSGEHHRGESQSVVKIIEQAERILFRPAPIITGRRKEVILDESKTKV